MLIMTQNLLLQPADPTGPLAGIPTLRVADFGFARFLPQASMAETLCGSPLYMAPEILRYEKYDAGADLWSVGAVLYEMAVGKAPFRAQNHVELLRKIERGDDRIKFPDDLSAAPVPHDIRALICALLKRNPADRMSFDAFFREADLVASTGAAKGIWPPPAAPSDTRTPVPASPSLARSSTSSPTFPDERALRPTTHARQPSNEGAFIPPKPPAIPHRQPSFAPKYVVGASASPPASGPPPTGASGLKTRDYAVPQAMPTARRMSSERRDRDTPPELVPTSRSVAHGADAY
jgi:serine/threonine-protein kinase ULK/ATG1